MCRKTQFYFVSQPKQYIFVLRQTILNYLSDAKIFYDKLSWFVFRSKKTCSCSVGIILECLFCFFVMDPSYFIFVNFFWKLFLRIKQSVTGFVYQYSSRSVDYNSMSKMYIYYQSTFLSVKVI